MVYGKVYLVGAGPGDPKLLTVRALEVFQIVDVAIYDRLVTREILELLPKGIRKINGGKAPHDEGMGQTEINDILIQESKLGHNVLRLKAGDPLLFSRGGEEIEAISAEGIEYEIVPGVSSAIGVASYAGIPLTRRGISSSIAIVTGHEDPSKEELSVDFQKLASTVDTIVVLMGVGKLQQISEQLIRGGARNQTPVAIIESGTRQTQRIQFSTLGSILDGALKDRLESPALIIVGEIVRSALALPEEKTVAIEQNNHQPQPHLELEQLAVAWCAAAEFT